MAYPSIISQPGSAARNYSPISEALRPWIEESIASSSSPSSSASDPSATDKSQTRARVLEIGSYPYAHIKRFAREFEEVEWYGSGRDEWEVSDIVSQKNSVGNLHEPFQLDIAKDEDWAELRTELNSRHSSQDGGFSGAVMCILYTANIQTEAEEIVNVIHCCPEGAPEHVFQQLSHSDDGSQLLRDGGWIAVYGPYLADDGTYKSEGDEEFDRNYIKAKDPMLGLRTVDSITTYATKWGFKEVERREMPKGNMWVVWRLTR